MAFGRWKKKKLVKTMETFSSKKEEDAGQYDGLSFVTQEASRQPSGASEIFDIVWSLRQLSFSPKLLQWELETVQLYILFYVIIELFGVLR